MKAVALVALLLAACAAWPTQGARVPTRAHVLADKEEEPEPPVWPRSFEARYTLTLPYVTALQTGGLHMPVRVVYDAGSSSGSSSSSKGGNEDGGSTSSAKNQAHGERLRLQLYGEQDVTVTSGGFVFSSYPRVNRTACDREAEPSGPTTKTTSDNNGNTNIASLAPFPVVSRPHWHYAGRALVPTKRGGKDGNNKENIEATTFVSAHVWQNTTRHAEGAKTSSYTVYVDASSGLPLRFYMIGYNILASSHYDEYLIDFEAFEARDFAAEASGGAADGKGGEFEVPDACYRSSSGDDEEEEEAGARGADGSSSSDGALDGNHQNSRTLGALQAQAAVAMPWSSFAQAAASRGGAGGGGLATTAAATPLVQQHPRHAALAYIAEWNARREQEQLLMLRRRPLSANNDGSNNKNNGNGRDASPPSPLLARPLLRANHLVDLTDEQYAATMTAAAGGLAARRARARRARALAAAAAAQSNGGASSPPRSAADIEDELARADAFASSPLVRKYHLGTLVPTYEQQQGAEDNANDANDANDDQKNKGRRPLPREVDWRGTVADPGPPLDQGCCGSCYGFSAVGTMSGSWAVATGQVRSLSPQQIVDCGWRTGNNGCGGGWIERSIAYIADQDVSGGAMPDELYPYTNANAWCGDKDAWPINRDRTPARGGTRDSPPPSVARFRGFAAIRPHDDQALMDAVANHGPVAVSIDASPLSFKFFGGGVYWSDECGWKPKDLDHAVLVMGYGSNDQGADYWLIRNSWSALWGENGYIKVKRGFGQDCGITTAPFLAVVDEEAAAKAKGGASRPLVEGWRPPVLVA